MKYDFIAIEKRWQQHWDNARTFATPNPGDAGFDDTKPKFYTLAMFPYPSGAGLHMGHALNYTATDIVARYKRMRGYNVLHPIGFDAFGLPAEQFAVKNNVHPRITTEKNIANMSAQLKRLGIGYDWDRAFATTDPDYVKWTQWIFIKLYHSYFDPVEGKAAPISDLLAKLEGEDYYVGSDGELIVSGSTESLEPIAGIGDPTVRKWTELDPGQRERLLDEYRLAFMAEVEVNWCPGLGTVLANEEVTNEGKSERGNYPVYKRPLKQWMLRITAYADRLIADLDGVDWPESIKQLQRNWIGKSIGAEVEFRHSDSDETIRVFTTRPDTLFGATYMVLAPEHPLVQTVTTPQRAEAVRSYQQQAGEKSSTDRQADAKEKTGVFTGGYAVNPVNDEKVPIWIADYVMMGYGTGAIMAVPAHDTRDYAFAKKFDLPIIDVVADKPTAAIYAFVERYDRDPALFPDEEKLKTSLIDFVAISVNQNETDYDKVWGLVNYWRKDDTAGDAPEQTQSRGSIAMIWKDAIEPLVTDGIESLFTQARAAQLGTMNGDAFTATDGALIVNSASSEINLNGDSADHAKQKITRHLERLGAAREKENIKLRDWLFSRQRYWGEPFPILHGPDGEIRTVNESDLPVNLPEMDDFKPSGSDDPDAPPQPPLGRADADWKTVTIDGVDYTRELNTMPNWAGSCWYYLRYLDNKNDESLVGEEAERYWMGDNGTDLYVGGAEHAVLHLLYARFWHKFLYDIGVVTTPEPFGKYFAQGYIQAYAYTDERGAYVPSDEVVEKPDAPVTITRMEPERETDELKPKTYQTTWYHGETPVIQEYGKMGKSLQNAVTPEDVCDDYGCDTLRLYEMYLGPLDQSKPWKTQDIVGVHRFLNRLWRVVFNEDTGDLHVTDDTPDEALDRKVHATIKRVTEAMEAMQFNVAIAAMIELNNELVKQDAPPRFAVESLVRMLGPIAPHVAEEIWSKLGHEAYLADTDWPAWDEAKLVVDSIEMPVQVNGKLRAKINVPADADQDTIEAIAKEDENVQVHLEDKSIRKVIVIKGRLINIVVG
jgi:leucyl-tRNA synthetase